MVLMLVGPLAPGGFITVQAQPARDRVLDDVSVSHDDECTEIRVGFNFPVRYVRHFPFTEGKELRIAVRPIRVGPTDLDAVQQRESMRPSPNGPSPLVDVVYDGEMAGGPYLILTFRRPVAFVVGQGQDFRSIVVTLPAPAKPDCLPPNPVAPPAQ
jgi:hypothetical protein